MTPPTHRFHREQFIAKPRNEVFSFFESPENLALLTPKELRFTLLTPVPIVMKAGAIMDYSIRVAGFPLRWRTIITEYEPPIRFVDQQLRGPYDFWHHTHEFETTEAGTRMNDTVVYRVGWGPAGQMANALYVRRSLERIFDYRAQAMAKLFDQ